MRRTAKEILKDRRGVSILLALMFMLLSAMVSSVIITAASTDVKRVHDDAVREQSYLSLQSGANLIRNMIQNTEVVLESVESGPIDSDGNYEAADSVTAFAFKSDGSAGPLKDILGPICEALFLDTGTETVSRTIHFQAALDGQPAVSPVSGTMNIIKLYRQPDPAETPELSGYQIKGTFSVEDSNQKLYLLTKTILFTVSETGQEPDPADPDRWINIKTVQFKWSEPGDVSLNTREVR